MAIVRVIRRDKENKDGNAPLYAVCNINREKIRIPVKLKVSQSEWDPFGGKILGRGSEIKDKNLIISNTMSRISDIFVRARLKNEKLTKEKFWQRYNNPSDFDTFHSFVSGYQKKISKGLELNTLKQHRSSLKKLCTYNPTLQFDELTSEFLKIYCVHLRKKLKNKETTIWKNISTIKIYILAAIKAGYIEKNPFEELKIKHPKSNVVYLTEGELNSMISLYKSNSLLENQQNILRFFLFMCFTSLHIGDAKRLRIDQISDGFLRYTRQKTRVVVSIPLSKPAMKLFEFYRSNRHQGNLFEDLPTDQDINRVLKVIAGKAGITKAISAKTARHTFATLYYAKNRGDIGTLSNILGHSTIRMTMVYAHVLRDSKIEGVHVFDGFL